MQCVVSAKRLGIFIRTYCLTFFDRVVLLLVASAGGSLGILLFSINTVSVFVVSFITSGLSIFFSSFAKNSFTSILSDALPLSNCINLNAVAVLSDFFCGIVGLNTRVEYSLATSQLAADATNSRTMATCAVAVDFMAINFKD